MNEDYETRIFKRENIDGDCERISNYMYDENEVLKKMLAQGKYADAALKFMQLVKSMCRHFIQDEHWCYFDDMYCPDYAISDMTIEFAEQYKSGRLPNDVLHYLLSAWKEIEATECFQEYGIPSVNMELELCNI